LKDFRLAIEIGEPIGHGPRRPGRVSALIANIEPYTRLQFLGDPLQASDALEHRRGPDRAEPFLYPVKGVLSTFAGELAFVAAVVDAQHCAAVIDDNQPTSAGLKYGVHFMNCCGILPAYSNLCSI
jgi:hypothetical protein